MNIYLNEAKKMLAERGLKLIYEFCDLNDLTYPNIEFTDITIKACGLYQPRSKFLIQVDIDKCARPSYMYSYPNLHINRTPQGVIAHEFGHYLQDRLLIFTKTLTKDRKEINEEPVTSYNSRNSSEWFAEVIRLFITNPDLLKLGRPKTYNWLCEELEMKPLNRGLYREVLEEFENNVSERIINRAENFANNIYFNKKK